MHKPTIVFDTNALISALMYPESVSAHSLVQATKYFQLVASDNTWSELVEVSSRQKFAKYFSEEARLIYLTHLAAMTHFFEIKSKIAECEDSTDNKFLELAVDAESQVIVSGDKHLRNMNPFRSIAIISPGDFLALLDTAN